MGLLLNLYVKGSKNFYLDRKCVKSVVVLFRAAESEVICPSFPNFRL